MLGHIKANRVIFLDIETAACEPDFERLSEAMKRHWIARCGWQLKEKETPATKFQAEAGLHSEFSKIICAVVGRLAQDKDGTWKLELKKLADPSEAAILKELSETLGKLPNDVWVAAYNGKGFDLPTVGRRMLVQGIPVPPVFDLSDKKPWELRLLDPMELFRFGERRHYCSMDLMATLMGIPSSKTGIKGEDVSRVYWEGGLGRIVEYCAADVRVLAQIFLKMKELPIDLTVV